MNYIKNKLLTIYYTTDVHELWEVTSNKEYIGWPVGLRFYTTFYIDSARTRPLADTGFSEYHDPVYYPETCGMT